MAILMVLTSHDRLGDTGERTGLWLEELAAPWYRFRDAGFDVVLASPEGGPAPVDPRSEAEEAGTPATRRFAADAQAQSALAGTRRLEHIRAGDFAAVFYPGGHGPLWDLAEDPRSIALIRAALDAGRPVGAVCHGPAALSRVTEPDGSPLVAGRNVTGFTDTEEAAVGLTDVVPFSIEQDFIAKGARYTRGPDFGVHVVADGPLVTGQNPASSEATADRLLAALREQSAAA